jgi:hypothetical protein
MGHHDQNDHARRAGGGGCQSNHSGRSIPSNHAAERNPAPDASSARPAGQGENPAATTAQTHAHSGGNTPNDANLHAQNPWDGGVVDRRVFPSRRDVESETGLERRRGAGRRLSDFQKSAEEGEMNQEQFMFLMAIDAFKKGNARQFPTWTDVLEIIRLLGYRKTMGSELCLNNAEDWTEDADAPANVRAARWHQRAAIDKARRDKPAA